MERKASLNQNGVSDADWEKTPQSVKRLVAVLSERSEHQQKQLNDLQSQIV